MAFFGFGQPLSASSPSLLEPRLKRGKEAPHSYAPRIFNTNKGWLAVPENNNPPDPTSHMISNALHGKLTSFFRNGHVFCASDLVGAVSAHTANISLDGSYDFQTRHLSAVSGVPEATKSLRNLFYIALKHDELPSYHFWTLLNDPNHTKEVGATDWDALFKASRPKGYLKNNNEDNGDEEHDEHAENAGYDEDDEDTLSGDDLFGEPKLKNNGGRGELDCLAFLNGIDPDDDKNKKLPAPTLFLEEPRVSSVPNGKNGEDARKSDEVSSKNTVFDQSKSNSGKPPASTLSLKESGALSSQSSGLGKVPPNIDTNARKGSMPPPKGSGASSARTPRSGQGTPNDNTTSRKGSVFPQPDGEESGGSAVLLRCERGGMWLKTEKKDDFKNKEFSDLAAHLAENETTDRIGLKVYVDILRSGETNPQEYQVGKGSQHGRNFHSLIKPCLSQSDYNFRIRSDAYSRSSRWDYGKPGTLKVTRVGIGYCYIDAEWDEFKNREINSDLLEEALQFLFGWEEGARQGRQNNVTLEIPPIHGTFDIDRNSSLLVSLELGKIFKEITSSPVISNSPSISTEVPYQYSAEIFVYQTGEKFVHPLVADAENMKAREEAALLEQQQAKALMGTNDTAQQTNQLGSNSAYPIPGLGVTGGPNTPSIRPRVYTQSEIEELERRLELAEDRLLHQTLESQENHFRLERDRLRSELDGAEQQVNYLAREHDDLLFQITSLGRQLTQRTQERDRLRRSSDDAETRATQLAEERDQLQRRLYDLERQAAAGVKSHHRGTQTRTPQPEVPAATAPDPPSEIADPKKLLYCGICLESVDKLNEDKRDKHAEKCKTTVSEFIRLTKQEAKDERLKRKEESKGTKGAASTAPKPQAGPSAASGDPTQESQAGRRAPKRKHSKGYKPAVEDELDDDEEDEELETPAKKTKGVKSAATAMSNVNTRSGRTRGQTPKHPTDFVEPDGDSSPSEIGAFHKGVKPYTAPDSDETEPPPEVRAVPKGKSSAPAKVTEKIKSKKSKFGERR